MKPVTFGEKLRHLRLQKNLTQQEVADNLGMYQQKYQKLESDRVEPSLKGLSQLAEYFNVDINWLLDSPSIIGYIPTNMKELPVMPEGALSSAEDIDGVRTALTCSPPTPEKTRHRSIFFDSYDNTAFAYPVVDDSMCPEFTPGEMIAVSPQATVQQGDFVLVNFHKKVMIRQVLFTPQKDILILKVFNVSYTDTIVDLKKMKCAILGRIICKQKRY